MLSSDSQAVDMMMEPIEALSEAVIDILKEYAGKKMSLTAAILREAFAGRREIVSILAPVADLTANEAERKLSRTCGEPAGVLPADPQPPTDPNIKALPELRNTFLNILDNLGAVIKGDYEKRFSELLTKIEECESLLSLSQLGEQVGIMVGELINQSVERTDFSNDFLFELSRDLFKMEEQLSSYQDYNRETHQISSSFNDDLLSHTHDIHHAFDSGKSPQDIRNIIASKLNTLSKAIVVKRRSDEARLSEADSKITELQNNLRTYEQEILQVRKRSESLEKEVMLDELTQINNRRAYDLQIRESLRQYERTSEIFSLILIDIDHFKNVNDNYGHKAGDKCLKEIANIIKSSLRQSDFLARYGGEELVAILERCDAANALIAAEKIRRRIENTRFSYHDETIPVTISLGVTEVMSSDTEPETPFVRVDEAMYRAKNGGRNRVCSNNDLPAR